VEFLSSRTKLDFSILQLLLACVELDVGEGCWEMSITIERRSGYAGSSKVKKEKWLTLTRAMIVSCGLCRIQGGTRNLLLSSSRPEML
jgi:hypothetical protein